MPEPTSLTMMAEALKHVALALETYSKERDWVRAHQQSRAALSTASRLHARLTALLEAQAELGELR